MKVDVGLFVAVVALCALTVTALLIPEEPGGHGVPHPDFSSMLHGGDGAARHGGVQWIGWGIGVLEILILVGCMALGARQEGTPEGDKREGSLRGLGVPFLWGTAAYVTVWTCIVLAYRGYLSSTDPPLYLALPAPTAIMMYVLWPIPVIFVLLFVVGFRRWVLSEEDLRKFRRIVAHRGARQHSNRVDAGAEKP